MSGSRWLGLWALPAIALVWAGAAEAADVARTSAPSSGRTFLEWNGAPAQLIHGVGASTADPRRAGEDVSLQVGANLDPAFYRWIHASWVGKSQPASGAVLACNSTGRCSRKEFVDATLTTVTVPACDASSKERGYFAVSIHPKSVKPSPETAAPPAKPEPPQKQWLVSNFKLAIDGVDCSDVRKIDSFIVKQGANGAAEIPNLRITTGMKGYASLQQWFQAAVAGPGGSNKKNGEIILYGPDLKTVLGQIYFLRLRVAGLQKLPQAGRDDIPKAMAHLRCEAMEMVWGAGPTATEAK